MVEDLSLAAVHWMIEAEDEDSSLYHGRAGTLLAVEEARAHFGSPQWDGARERGLDRLADDVATVEGSSLYFGLAGVAFTLHALGRAAEARNALDVIASRQQDGRWSDMFELFAGNAGIGLGALHAGGPELAVAAVTPYLSTWTATPHGVNWPVRPTPPRSHHIAHGTLGIVYALAAVGAGTGRSEMVELAVAGAEDVVGRNEAGPAGDAQVFRLLEGVTGVGEWGRLGDSCWHTITTSGLPQRLRPGFWDNNGRCCGTAGVLALACDRIVESGDGFGFADGLVDDLVARSTRDGAGARWSNHEHRRQPPDLDPRPGWAMGNAGIVRELLRYARLCRGLPGEYAVAWPEHPPARA